MKKPKITNSNKLYNKANKIIPGGSQTFSKGVTQFVEVLHQNIYIEEKVHMCGMSTKINIWIM